MLTRKSILTMTTAAALCAAPVLAQGQQSTGGSSTQPQATQTTPQQGPMSSTTGAETGRDASGGMQAQGGSAPGGGAAGRGAPAPGTPQGAPVQGAPQGAAQGAPAANAPDGTSGNPPGTAAGRAVDRALGTNMSGTNPEGANAGSGAATGATTPGMEVDSVRLREGRRASRIIGSTVYNENNESIGEVDDLIITREGGQPTAVLSVGGFLGIGARLVAVPLERLSWNTERERWSMPGATKDSLSGLPAFNYAERRG
jgi:hypothetical protein